MTQHMKRRVRAQSGQALVEFLVATMLATSVLLMAVVMLGKFNDIQVGDEIETIELKEKPRV